MPPIHPQRPAVKPITPLEVASHKANILPNEVLEAFNDLIAQNWDGDESFVKQNDAVTLIIQKMGLTDNYGEAQAMRQKIFDKGWLNVEQLYEKAGWKVKYEKPLIGDNFEAYFEFTRKGK